MDGLPLHAFPLEGVLDEKVSEGVGGQPAFGFAACRGKIGVEGGSVYRINPASKGESLKLLFRFVEVIDVAPEMRGLKMTLLLFDELH